MAPTYTVTRIDFSANTELVATVNLAFVVSKVTPAGKLDVPTSTALQALASIGHLIGKVVVAAIVVVGNVSDVLLLNKVPGIANDTNDVQSKIS